MYLKPKEKKIRISYSHIFISLVCRYHHPLGHSMLACLIRRLKQQGLLGG